MSIHHVQAKSVHTRSDTSHAGLPARVLLMASLAILCAGICPALALDRMGSATEYLGAGQISVGLDYVWSQTDLKAGGSSLYTFSEILGGGWIVDQDYRKHEFTMKNVDVHRFYATIGYGLGERSDLFLRVGAARVDWNGEDGTRPAFGAGIRTTFHESGPWRIGGLAQIGRTEARFDDVVVPRAWTGSASMPMDAELSLWEVQLAATASYQLSTHLRVYGGPFLYFATGEFDAETTNGLTPTIPELRGISLENTYDIEETARLGGHIGLNAEITERITLGLEYQHTADADAVTVGLLCRL